MGAPQNRAELALALDTLEVMNDHGLLTHREVATAIAAIREAAGFVPVAVELPVMTLAGVAAEAARPPRNIPFTVFEGGRA
jgi:hypothetical protein